MASSLHTPIYNLHYPAATDTPAAAQYQQVASDIETALGTVRNATGSIWARFSSVAGTLATGASAALPITLTDQSPGNAFTQTDATTITVTTAGIYCLMWRCRLLANTNPTASFLQLFFDIRPANNTTDIMVRGANASWTDIEGSFNWRLAAAASFGWHTSNPTGVTYTMQDAPLLSMYRIAD